MAVRHAPFVAGFAALLGCYVGAPRDGGPGAWTSGVPTDGDEGAAGSEDGSDEVGEAGPGDADDGAPADADGSADADADASADPDDGGSDDASDASGQAAESGSDDDVDPESSDGEGSSSDDGALPPPGDGVAAILDEDAFYGFFPDADPFYDYDDFVAAADTYPGFAGSGDATTDAREVAAFLANVSHETGGLVYIEEIAMGEYCSWSPQCPCSAGELYFGRGPIQLSWNFNYCAAGDALGVDLVSDPDVVAQNGLLAWQTAFWFWMSSEGAGSTTCHDAMSGGAGFGATIQTINGAIECGGGNPGAVDSRVEAYLELCDVLGVDPGGNLYC